LTYILILFHIPVFQEWLEVGGVDSLSEPELHTDTVPYPSVPGVARIIYMGGHTLSYLTYILILFHTPVFQEWLEIGGLDTFSQI